MANRIPAMRAFPWHDRPRHGRWPRSGGMRGRCHRHRHDPHGRTSRTRGMQRGSWLDRVGRRADPGADVPAQVRECQCRVPSHRNECTDPRRDILRRHLGHLASGEPIPCCRPDKGRDEFECHMERRETAVFHADWNLPCRNAQSPLRGLPRDQRVRPSPAMDCHAGHFKPLRGPRVQPPGGPPGSQELASTSRTRPDPVPIPCFMTRARTVVATWNPVGNGRPPTIAFHESHSLLCTITRSLHALRMRLRSLPAGGRGSRTRSTPRRSPGRTRM